MKNAYNEKDRLQETIFFICTIDGDKVEVPPGFEPGK